MTKIKDVMLAIVVILVFGFLLLFVYRNESTKTNRELAKRIAELSPRGGPPQSIDGLKKAIAVYEAQIERNVREGAQTGAYWKILAIRLSDRGMHNDALAALERAIYYNAEDPFLFYLTGVSAGTAAKSVAGFSANAREEKEHFYKLSESAYLRAIELDGAYSKPMYGLGILYAFELDNPKKAAFYLENYLKLQPTDVSAMSVLARAHYMNENFREAIELYEMIISRTKDKNIKADAQNNIDLIERLQHE